MSNKCLSIFPLERLGVGPEAAGHLSKVTECPAQESPCSAREPHSHGRIWAQRWLGGAWPTGERSAHLPLPCLRLRLCSQESIGSSVSLRVARALS